MSQKAVKKYTKGEVYLYSDGIDKNNVSQDQSLLVGSRPVMVIKGGEHTSLIVPFTRNPADKTIAVEHTNDVVSYVAHDMVKSVNNKELYKYLSTVNNPTPIVKLVSDYIYNDNDSIGGSEEVVLVSDVFSAGQIWKKKEGPYFLITKVLGKTKENSYLLIGIVLDQTSDDDSEYDIEIPWFERKFHVDMYKTITVTSNDINYYQGRIDDSLLNQFKMGFIEIFYDDESKASNLNINQINNVLGRTDEYNPVVDRYVAATEEKPETKVVEKDSVKRKRYSDEEKYFILINPLQNIADKFSLTSDQAYKVKYYITNSYKKALYSEYSEDEIKFMQTSSVPEIEERFNKPYIEAKKMKIVV